MSILLRLEKAIFGTKKSKQSRYLEKEIKILNVDVRMLQTVLEANGAQKYFEGVMDDTYYTLPASKTSKKDSLRIRRTSDVITVCYKKKKQSSKLKKAYEHEIKLPFTYNRIVQTILGTLGCFPKREKTKHRISYSIGTMKFDLDHYPGLPPLLEIEGPTKKRIWKRVKALGLRNAEIRTYGTKKLFQEYGQTVTSL